ncbi:MAG: Flp pilus assembly complex ATPase component TadA [Deltaproteobacteria bacterium]|nr:Flp pilus assembly complex ATPase component TadA [Deltaproteobacteria bacterium]
MFMVIVTEKGGEQRRMEFDKPEVTIGRVQGNDIILPKGNVSKRHSRIVLKDGKFIIVDLKSTNGTYVNGRKITSPLVIKETDKVYIGDFILHIEEGGAMASADLPPPSSALAPMGGAPMQVEEERVASPPAPAPHAGPPPPPRKSTVPPTAPPPRRSVVQEIPPPVAEPLPPPAVHAPQGVQAPVAMDGHGAPPAAPPERITSPRPATKPPATSTVPAISSPPDPPRPARPTAPQRDPVALRQAAPSPAVSQRMPEPPAPRVTEQVPSPRAEGTPRASGPGAPLPRSTAPLATPSVAVPPAPSPAAAPVAAAPVAAVPVAAAPVYEQDLAHAQLVAAACEQVASQIDPSVTKDGAPWQQAERALRRAVENLDDEGQLLSSVDKEEVIKDALHELLGLGPIDELLEDEEVSAVLVYQPQQVLVNKGGHWVAGRRGFSSAQALLQAVSRLIAPSGSVPTPENPVVDVRLADGLRVFAVLPPAAVQGPCLSLTKARRTASSLEDLVSSGMLSSNMAQFLGTCVAGRRNILVCGSQGSGRTALLAALAGYFSSTERVVSVEEVAELGISSERWVSLECAPLQGSSGASLRDLLRMALRMQPDRLVVGDVREACTLELLSALASTGEGALVGIAADGARVALARLEAFARIAGESTQVLRELIASCIHVVVHVAQHADGVDRVASICEVIFPHATGDAAGDDRPVLQELFIFQLIGRDEDGRLRGRFAGTGVVPRFFELLEARGLPTDPSVFK